MTNGDLERLTKIYPGTDEWTTCQDEMVWQLFLGPKSDGMPTHPLQIIKAPKKSKQYAEYWPSPEQEQYMLAALNNFPALAAELLALRKAIAVYRFWWPPISSAALHHLWLDDEEQGDLSCGHRGPKRAPCCLECARKIAKETLGPVDTAPPSG